VASAGVSVSISEGGIVTAAAMVLGGVQPKQPVFSTQLPPALVGKPWSRATLAAALPALMAEVPLDELSSGGRPEWRRALYGSFLLKFLATSGGTAVAGGAAPELPRPVSSGVQTFEVPETGGITQTLGAQYSSGSGDLVQGREPAPLMHVYGNTSHERLKFDEQAQVRKTPSWPRSWANFSLLWLDSHRNA
jgi:hypothetical protein